MEIQKILFLSRYKWVLKISIQLISNSFPSRAQFSVYNAISNTFHATFGVQLDPLYTPDLPICSFENQRTYVWGAFFSLPSPQTVRKGTLGTRCIQLRELISASVEFTAQEQSKKFARSPVSQLVFELQLFFLANNRRSHATRRQSGEDDDNSGFTPTVRFLLHVFFTNFSNRRSGPGFKTVPALKTGTRIESWTYLGSCWVSKRGLEGESSN